MGSKRIGLARTQALLENLKRELSLNASMLKGIKRETIACTAASATTLTAEQSGALVVLSGGSAATVTLPAVADGLHFEFFARTAQAHVILAQSAVIQGATYDNRNTATDGPIDRQAVNDGMRLTLANAAVGDRLVLTCDGTNWYLHAFCNDTPTVAGS
tara:strand:- start:4179 stop:4655 length:477 start_codon:yes stop_codon:yes gene_type:complete